MRFNYVRSGDPARISATFYNALVDLLNKVNVPNEGISDKSSVVHQQSYLSKPVIEVEAAEDIPQYSIFTIDSGQDTEFEYDRPTAITKQIVNYIEDQPFLINEANSLDSGTKHRIQVLGFHKPFQVRYDPQDGIPELGSVIGPKNNTYVLSAGNKGCLAVSEPDTEINRIWVVRHPSFVSDIEESSIIRIRAKDCFYPGTSGLFDVYSWDGNNWIDSGNDETAYDLNNVNFLLPGEFTWAKLSSGNRYDIIGSQGLKRAGVALEDIDCRSTGLVQIYAHDLQQGSGLDPCIPNITPCSVTVCNHWGWNRDVEENDEVYVIYFENMWQIMPFPRATEALAKLDQKMCPNDFEINIKEIEMLDYCPEDNVLTAENIFGLSGISGQMIYIKRYRRNRGWFITQVEHGIAHILVAKNEEDTGTVTQDCELQVPVIREASLMYCNDPEDTTLLTMTREYLVNDVKIEEEQQGGCSLKTHTLSVCVLSPENVGWTTVHEYVPVNVITGLELVEQTNTFAASVTTIYAPCIGSTVPVGILSLCERYILGIPQGDTPILEFIEDEQELCFLKGHVERVLVFACETLGLKEQISLTRVNIVEDVELSEGQGSVFACPSITKTTTNACVFTKGESATGDVISFQQQIVVTDLEDDGTCVSMIQVAVCVAAIDYPTVRTDVICGVDCEY